MTYLHPTRRSPDPAIDRPIEPVGGVLHTTDLFPHQLVETSVASAEAWGRSLDLFKPPPTLTVEPGAEPAWLLLDFGTEVHGVVHVTVETDGPANLHFMLGETAYEARGYVPNNFPSPDIFWRIDGAGRHSRALDELSYRTPWQHRVVRDGRGLRYLGIRMHDLTAPLRLVELRVRHEFAFAAHRGSFTCSDPDLQRIWETCVYSARLCTRSDSIWDGIKRDRTGWFGDASIVAKINNAVFFEPGPIDAMLDSMPDSAWARQVPTFTFEAINVLRDHVLAFGADRPPVREAFRKVCSVLDWIRRTQVDADGFIVRDPHGSFFGGIGFLDWSVTPFGGRFEELCWLQAYHLYGLRSAIDIAHWLGEHEHARRWEAQAAALAEQIRQRFWRPGVGFVHTLNTAGEPLENPLLPGAGGHYRATYELGRRFGPSGTSRHAAALAVLAGLVETDEQRRTVVDGALLNPDLPSMNTPYFRYFTTRAAALCGEPGPAWQEYRDYMRAMIVEQDVATVWELFHPDVQDLRKYYSHWQLGFCGAISCCHPWGGGIVPLTVALLAGVQPLSPAHAQVQIAPSVGFDLAFDLRLPTAQGELHVWREVPHGPIAWDAPPTMHVAAAAAAEHGASLP